MPSPTEITISQLSRLIGLPSAPVILDVRLHEDWIKDPRLIPGAHRFGVSSPTADAKYLCGGGVILVCEHGKSEAQGRAALLRHQGIDAQTLDGGFAAWRAANEMLLKFEKIPELNKEAATVWVTRARPKIDRVACPWLIRRFVDPRAVFLFVAPEEVARVAEKFNATPFDVDDVFWSHRGELCTFDTMIMEFDLDSPALARLAEIVRGADTARLSLSPQSAGLLAASLGFSRMYRDDLDQLEATFPLYDAMYRWCRDATDETHDWPAGKATNGKPRK